MSSSSSPSPSPLPSSPPLLLPFLPFFPALSMNLRSGKPGTQKPDPRADLPPSSLFVMPCLQRHQLQNFLSTFRRDLGQGDTMEGCMCIRSRFISPASERWKEQPLQLADEEHRTLGNGAACPQRRASSPAENPLRSPPPSLELAGKQIWLGLPYDQEDRVPASQQGPSAC